MSEVKEEKLVTCAEVDGVNDKVVSEISKNMFDNGVPPARIREFLNAQSMIELEMLNRLFGKEAVEQMLLEKVTAMEKRVAPKEFKKIEKEAVKIHNSLKRK